MALPKKNILDAEQLPLLKEFSRGKTCVIFDFDGTLAPIVEHPHNARLTDSTEAHLEQMCIKYPTAVLSGRSRSDVLEKL